jgi:hypothetical protein
MSQHQLTICSNIIEESYGKLAEIITSHLLRRGGKSLGEMSTELHIDKSDIVNVLCVLMQHNLIHSTSPKSNVVVYQATPSDIIERLMYPHYIGIGREVGGSAAEDIMMDLITRGSSPMSQVTIIPQVRHLLKLILCWLCSIVTVMLVTYPGVCYIISAFIKQHYNCIQ